jgi:hypothetical protein
LGAGMLERLIVGSKNKSMAHLASRTTMPEFDDRAVMRSNSLP